MEDEATQPGISQPSFDPNFLDPYPSSSDTPKRQTRDSTADIWEATQIVIDPRRLGNGGSGFNDEDLADIFCILHPASKPSNKASVDVYKATPQHTITEGGNSAAREQDGEGPDVPTQELVSYDIALRLSATLKDPIGGFYFGRNNQRCDIAIGQTEPTRRISNIHFRIYINEYGIIMLEDQSTNGTGVEGCVLRGKEKENGMDYRHTLEQGTIVTLYMTPPDEDYRFIIRIPQRDEESDMAYQQNLAAYFRRLNHARAENEARTNAAGGEGKKEPINLFPTHDTPDPTSITFVGRSIKEWKGGAKYKKVGCIGKGAFAVVYKITAKFDGVPYAAKELEKRRFMKNGILDQKVDREMEIMRKIQHPNVVQYIDHVDWNDYLYIIMEFVPGGDLGSLINQHGHLVESDAQIMAGQLLSALKYLHNKGITHRDVKPDNILIYSRQPFHVKLTDFGLSKMIDSEETFLRTFCGTLFYCAPEVYTEYREYDATGRRTLRGVDKKLLPPQIYGHAVDIWSLAGVLFYALCGSPPYPVKTGTSHQELLNQIMTQPLDIRPLQRVNISESGIRFVRSMLHTRPEYRATIQSLERMSWLGGDDSLEVSMDNDEVDMIVDSAIDPNLEQETSQLSIHHDDDCQLDSREECSKENVSNDTEIQRLEIPNSFETSNNSSTGNESFGFLQDNQGNRNARLFGEVNASAIGSSGAIPVNELQLPLPTHMAHYRDFNHSDYSESRYTQGNRNASPRIEDSFHQNPAPEPAMADNITPPTMPPPPPKHIALSADKTQEELEERAGRSSSLMGAESMVGHLNMNSPSSGPATSPTPTIENREITVSLRRPRDDDESWRPDDLPAKRVRKSKHDIDMILPVGIFWDPMDKSTHHNDYPIMSTLDYRAYSEYAEKKGEKFVAGQKIFETTMQRYRSSRSPSIETEATRARSESMRGEGRRMFMKRDERKLSDAQVTYDQLESQSGRSASDAFIPSTAHPSNASTPSIEANAGPDSQPVVHNDFQLPRRILAKIIATRESCLPTITINITEPVTSWGRGYSNTFRYTNGQETRLPKYAFKILLFKTGFYNDGRSYIQAAKVWNDKDHDMTFYLSTKATAGIWINGKHLTSHEPKQPTTPSKLWGELRHGDILTVWLNSQDHTEYSQFRFECFWGKSRAERKAGEEFTVLPQGDLLHDIEYTCLVEEAKILTEQATREDEQKKALREREKLLRERPVDFTQSFSSAPPPAS